MKQIVDVVNFNADASCLSSKDWIHILSAGNESLFVKWLKLYIDLGKKVVLGFPGATIADIVFYNPDAINLINSYPDIFEVIIRPFSHDIALLRQARGFQTNIDYGHKVIVKEFRNLSNYFLPPEFMLTNEQIMLLQNQGILGVFINPGRFTTELRSKIPVNPYKINGLHGSTLNCIPFCGQLTNSYLHALQMYDCTKWNTSIRDISENIIFSWRDGESSFFLPDSLERELFWLKGEDSTIPRAHTKEVKLNFIPNDQLKEYHFKTYPVHSCSAWMKEFRMLGFINRIQHIEQSFDRLSLEQVYLWLMTINSDILSSIEKNSPIIALKPSPNSKNIKKYVIERSDRGFEGEEYLSLLELSLSGAVISEYAQYSNLPHMMKWRNRSIYLKNNI
jgi:hypothetical protein